MNSMLVLLVREWREHRGAYLWGAGLVLGLIILFGLTLLTISDSTQVSISSEERQQLQERLERQEGTLESVITAALDVAGTTDAELEQRLDTVSFFLNGPFHLVFMFAAVFVLASSLYDERRDQTLLFWKSMPVSDSATVLSKLLLSLCAAPLVVIAATWCAQLFVTIMISLYAESGMAGRVWAASDLWLRPLELVGSYLVWMLWALPLFAWLLLVSARVGKIPLLWGIGLPWLVIVLERILFSTSVVYEVLGRHLLMIMRPYPALLDSAQWLRLELWLGVLLGVGLVALTVWCRKRYNEI